MYKIYSNHKRIIIGKNTKKFFTSDNSILYNADNISGFHDLVHVFIKNVNSETLFIVSERPKKDFKRFCSAFKVVKAAGGLARNTGKEFLMIFRNGKWDLPKGKIEGKETCAKTALREVEEETGVRRLMIKKKLPKTYHLFFQKDELILKVSIWYKMKTDYDRKPVPQRSENITSAVWMSKSEVLNILPLAYDSIADLLKRVIEK
jgi:hypothetical protein